MGTRPTPGNTPLGKDNMDGPDAAPQARARGHAPPMRERTRKHGFARFSVLVPGRLRERHREYGRNKQIPYYLGKFSLTGAFRARRVKFAHLLLHGRNFTSLARFGIWGPEG